MNGNLTVFKASAGSGKTFTLTAQYIALLLSGESAPHRAILAVTFTNKATAEMKERILQELWEIAYRPEETGSFVQAVRRQLPGVPLETLRQRAANALHAIIHDYDYFRIETIDAFFQSLLTTLAHELNLSAGFRVEIDDKQVVENAVDRLMASIDRRENLRQWVLSYISERIEDNQRWDVTKEVKRLARQIMKEQFLLHEEELLHVLDSEQTLKEYRQELNALMRSAEQEIAQKAAALLQKGEEYGGFEQFNRGNNIVRYVSKIAAGSVEAPTDAFRKYIESTDTWLKKADRENAAARDCAERLREQLAALDTLRRETEPIINSCQLTLRYLNPLRLIGEIGREAGAINRENNRFMLAKTPLLFNRLVGSDDASFVFEKAGTEFRHVMIDEFQDTSTLQWANFKRLLVENMAQGNGCLLVGDVKQSIYRFRNGDWKILNGIEREFGHYPIEIHNLDTNYRSARHIVEFNNGLFPKIAHLLDRMSPDSGISGIYADVEQKDCGRPGGRVEIRYTITSKGRDKAIGETTGNESPETSIPDQLAEEIKALHESGIAYNDMAILVRSNRSVSDILQAFSANYADIPLISDEAFLLSSSPAVLLVIHALRYLTDENNTVSRAFAAHTYQHLVLNHTLSWEKLLENGTNSLPEGYVKHMETLREMPLYELTERLIELFGIGRIEDSAPYIFCLLDEIINYTDGGSPEITAFLKFWDDTLSSKAIPGGEIHGVRILTIHKSKGLAFHTVFLPYCDWYLEKDLPEDLLWCTPQAKPYDTLPLVPIRPGKQMQASVYKKTYEAEHLDRRTEHLNLMYVAFTRAKQNLFVWAKTRGETDLTATEVTMGDLLYAATEGEDVSIGTAQAASSPRKSGFPAEKANEALPYHTVNPLKPHSIPEQIPLETYRPQVEFRQSNTAKDFISDNAPNGNASYIDIGKLMHRIFSMIHTLEDVEAALAELYRSGMIPTDKEREALRHLVTKRMENPTVKDWFSSKWNVYNECSILSRDAEGRLLVRRPDRVMQRGDHTVVVDFKFGNAKPEYYEQVSTYCRLLINMGHRNVKGYLWYVYTGKIDPVCTMTQPKN